MIQGFEKAPKIRKQRLKDHCSEMKEWQVKRVRDQDKKQG